MCIYYYFIFIYIYEYIKGGNSHFEVFLIGKEGVVLSKSLNFIQNDRQTLQPTTEQYLPVLMQYFLFFL